MTASCVLALCLLAPPGGSFDPRQTGPTPEAERLLRLVEDADQPYAVRVAAVDALRQRREPATVPRLTRLLPGNADVVTLRVVIALGEIGDRRALPALRKMQNDPNIDLPGKINTAVDGTIRALGGRSR